MDDILSLLDRAKKVPITFSVLQHLSTTEIVDKWEDTPYSEDFSNPLDMLVSLCEEKEDRGEGKTDILVDLFLEKIERVENDLFWLSVFEIFLKRKG